MSLPILHSYFERQTPENRPHKQAERMVYQKMKKSYRQNSRVEKNAWRVNQDEEDPNNVEFAPRFVSEYLEGGRVNH